MSNRGRHRKKKNYTKLTYKDLIDCINLMKNDGTFYNFKNNTQYQFSPYFLINEQKKA